MKATLILIVLPLLLAACSPSSSSNYHHPSTLEEVLKDGRFRKVFTSDAGTTFYVRNLDPSESRKLSNDELAADFVLNSDSPMLYVAVQADGKVLQKPAPIGELGAFGVILSQQLSATPDRATNGAGPVRSDTNSLTARPRR